MGLTPDEIAHRAFTPSADGYHQGEVREFLQRIASELQGLHAALPEGGAEIMGLAASLNAHEPRLTDLEAELARAIRDLSTATTQLTEAQAQTEAQLVAAKGLVADQAAAGQSAARQREVAADIAAEQRAVLDRLRSDQQAMSAQISAPRSTAPTTPVTATPVPTASALAPPQRPATPTPGSTPTVPFAASPARTADALASSAAASAPSTTQGAAPSTPPPATTAPPATAKPTVAQDPLALFGSDLENQPLFSDSANDLLDGVLDDVLGNLNEGT